MTLHILNQPASHLATSQVFSAINPDDHLLLIEEAVTAVLSIENENWKPLIGQASVLYEDLLSRGLADKIDNGCLNGFKVIDIRGFVALTEQFAQVVTWT